MIPKNTELNTVSKIIVNSIISITGLVNFILIKIKKLRIRKKKMTKMLRIKRNKLMLNYFSRYASVGMFAVLLNC